MMTGSEPEPSLFDRVERIATYIVLIALIGGELLSKVIKTLDSTLDSGGAVVLLATALLLVLRRIDRHLGSIRPVLEATDFTSAVSRVLRGTDRIEHVRVLANDASKYYVYLSELKGRVERLEVLVSDDHDRDRWQRLAERKLAGSVEVRRTELPPVMHYIVVEGHAAAFGPFLRGPSHASPFRSSFAVVPASTNGTSLIEALCAHFDVEWRRAAPPTDAAGTLVAAEP